jgi:hypothetical protein
LQPYRGCWFVKLTSDSFCANRVFTVNIQFCCPVTCAAVVFGLCPSSGILKNTMFRKLDVVEHENLRINPVRTQQSRCVPPPCLGTEPGPVDETLCSLEHRTRDKFQKSRVNRMWKNAIVATFKVLPNTCLSTTNLNHKVSGLLTKN